MSWRGAYWVQQRDTDPQQRPNPPHATQKDPVMKKLIAIAILATAAALSTAPANAQMSALKSFDNAASSSEATIVHKTGRRGRFAAGLAIGIVGAAIATHHYNNRRPYYSSRWSRHERRCRRLRRACYNGYGRACWKYDNRC